MRRVLPKGQDLSVTARISRFFPLLFCSIPLLFQSCTAGPEAGGPVYSLSSPREAPRSAATIASDALILTRIQSKIHSDDLVSQEGAQITVRHGVVYLEGSCTDHYQGRMLADLIRTVDGVAGVENRLQPSQTGTSFLSPNGFVAEKIRLHLQKDEELRRMDIKVTATNHQVVLTGRVGNRDQKMKASAIAQPLAGERQVVNQLREMAE